VNQGDRESYRDHDATRIDGDRVVDEGSRPRLRVPLLPLIIVEVSVVSPPLESSIDAIGEDVTLAMRCRRSRNTLVHTDRMILNL
jgi:hypothetical protein